MDDSRTKLVGPAIAAGAVSLGLIIIGACGVGQQDVYVPPPPLNADLAAAPARIADETTSTTTRISIPPSPTWRIAPYMSPRKPFSLSSTETSPSEPPAEGESTTESRPSEATTESRPPATTSEDHTTTPSSTTTTRPIPTLTTPPRIRPTVDDEEAAETDDPTTHSHDNTTAPGTPATPTPAATTEAPTSTVAPTTTDDES